MKKLLTFFLTTLLAYAVGFDVGWAGSITFADLGLSDGVQYSAPFDGGDFTVTFAGGTNDGKYYNSGAGIRVYGGGTMTIAAKTGNISNISITFSGNYKPTSNDVVNTGAYDNSTGVWTGSASSVVFTRPSGSGNWRVQSITVTTSGGSTPSGPTTPTATVGFNPAAGEVASGTSVTLSLSGTADGFVYTTDSSAPSATNGTKVTSGTATVTVSAATTIKAAAYNTDGSTYAFGTETSAAYTIASSTPGGSGEYVKVTSASDLTSGQYLIVYEDGNVAFNGGLSTLDAVSNTIAVTINSNTIPISATTTAAEFTIDTSAGTIKSASGYYIGNTSNTNALTASSTALTNSLTYNDGDIDIVSSGGAYLRYNSASNQLRFRYFKSSSYTGQKAIQLYKRVEAAVDKAYDVTVATGLTGGSVAASPSGEKVVDSGDQITVTATPATGYDLSAWNITGVSESMTSLGTTNPATVTATGNVNVSASFTQHNYTISTAVNPSNAATDGNSCAVWMQSGFTLIENVATATYGATVSVKLHTSNGWMVDGISITGVNANDITLTNTEDDGKTYSFPMPAQDITITGNFTPYRPTLSMAGRFNGNTGWRTSGGPEFTYNSSNDEYTLDVYFTGEGDGNYFYFRAGNSDLKAANGNESNYGINDNNMSQTHSLGGSRNFEILSGVYTFTVNGALTTLNVTPKTYTIAFSPASGSEVEQGTQVTASCTLESDINAIKNTDSGAAGDVTVTCNPSTLNTVGANQQVTATATIGNYSVPGTANYTVTAVNTSNRYEVITAASAMEASKKYLLVVEDKQNAYTGGNAAESVTIANHVIELSSSNGPNVKPLTMGSEVINGTTYYNFSYTDGGTTYYVANTSNGNNAIGTETSLSDNGRWSLDEPAFKNTYNIQLKSKSFSRLLRSYTDANGTTFRSYTGESNQPVQLYRQAVEEVKDYTITYAEVTGGSATGATGANEGETVTVTATPASGYACTGITVNPTATVTDNGDGTYSFTMPAANVTVTPTFEEAIAITYVNKYIDNNGVEQTGSTGGTVTGPAAAVQGSTVNLTVTPSNDYQLQAGSLVYSWNNGAGQSAVAGNGTTVPYFFTMPGTATTVTAVFEKKPYTFTVVSANGSVTGLPASAVSGTSVTFGVTPDAGYAVTGVAVTWEEGEQSGTVGVTDNNDGTYTFNMVAHNVTITVSYFAGDEYELLTNYSDINENDTYLIVGGPTDGTKTYVMGNTLGDSRLDAVALTSSNYVNDKILSTSDMSIIQFVAGTGDNAGKWAIYDNSLNAYLNATSSGKLATSSTASYGTISIDAEDHNRAHIKTGNNGALYLSFNNGNSKMFRFYSSEQATTYIFKVANANKVKRPTVTGIGTAQNIGKYNFIGKDNVTIECATEGATIEYSLDGGNTWQSYSEAVEITTNAAGNTVVVMARATKTGMEPSDAVTATFTCIKPQKPTFGTNWDGENDVTFYNPMFIYPKRNTGDVDVKAYGAENIYFYRTFDGTTPAVIDANKVTDIEGGKYYIYLDKTVDLSVVKVINGIASDPAEGILTFAVAAPEFSLAAGNYDGDQTTRLSTATKTTQNNVTWTTQMYYTFDDDAEFAIDQATGEVTGGWTLYDATNSPYVTIEAPGTKTLRAVTVANYFNGKSEWHQSEVSQAVYVLTTANLQLTVSPAPGTYTYTQTVTIEPKNAIGNVSIYYTTDGSTPGTGSTLYNGPITVDNDMTIKVYAEDSRDVNAEGKTVTGEYEYKIGVQAPVFSPLPGNYYTGNNGDITVQMFSVSPNAKIYYTTDGSTPSKTNGTLYTGDVPLNTGATYNFKAVAYVGNKASAVSNGTYTIGAKLTGNYWQNIAEMNAETDHNTVKTLANPVQVVYMSLYRNGDGTTSYIEPEFAYVRDNSGYGLIYFGAGNIATYEDYTVFQMGDWLPGGTITGKPVIWGKGFMNELGGGSSTTARVTAWPTEALSNTEILPVETTNARIIEGWDSKGTAVSGGSAVMASHVVADKNMFGHYVHLRKNTITDVTGAGNGTAKHSGLIKDESGEILNYYDGMYLYSGYDRQGSGVESPDYDQTEFDKVQDKGGTYDVYAIVSFYSDNAGKAMYDYVPFQVFPIDFEYTYPALFHMDGNTYEAQTQEVTVHETKTVTLTCDKEGAQIWYKTSEMEDYVVYEGPITVDKTMTIETYSSYPSKYNDYLESKIYTLTVNLGEVPQPVISPESSLNAVGDPAIDVTIGFESGVEVPEGITIYYTTDGTDPSTSETREVYVPGTTELSFNTTTTVRAIAFLDDFYSTEADERTYTFVRSNGIIYSLVTSESELDENSVYVVVNQAEAMSMQRTQKDNNRDAAPVLFVTESNMPTGHTFAGNLKEVYGNDDLAVFTMRETGTGEWYFHTANGVNNASTGFLYGAVSGSTNQLKTNTADNPAGVQNINWTIEIDADGTAHMFNLYNDQPRYLRFNKSFGLYNTYGSESTGLPVYLYKKAATPLALIEKMGTTETGHNQYTIADELVVVHAFGNKLWVKDQGNLSIAKREKPDGQIDYMRETAASGTSNGVTVLKQEGEWDQSNWAIIEFLNSDMTEEVVAGYKDKFIKPASLTGIYSDNLNYTIQVPATVSKNEVDAWIGDAAEYTPNVFSPSNFLDANLTDEGVTSTVNNVTYFFMNPKVQEVATITYAVWDGSKFVVPAKYNEVLNGADLPGAFTPEWTYNPGGKPELTVGEAYQFLAVMNRVPQGDGNGAPRKVNGKEGNADTNKVVMPLNLSGGSGNIVTAIDDINTANREVVGVEYYNVAGQRSDRPVEGVNIVVTRYSDGSTSTAKVLK